MNKSTIICLLAIAAIVVGCSNKTSVDEHINAGKTYLAIYDYKNAKEEFIEANRIDSENPEALLGLCEIFHHQGRIRHAYQTLKRLNELDPNNSKVHYLLGLTYLQAGKPNKAKEHAIKSLELDSAATENLILFAQAHRGKVESHKAIEFINRISRKVGSITEKSVSIGILYTNLRQTNAAKKELEEALILDPKSSEAHIALARLYWQNNELEKADSSFQKAVETAQRYSIAELRYANFKRKTGSIQNAKEILENSVLVVPDHIPSLIEIADISLETREYSEGIDRTAQIIEIDPTHPGALLLDGKLKLAANRPGEAVISFKTMTESFPSSSVAHLQLALAYLDENQPNHAAKHLHAVRSLNPDSSDASILLASLDIKQSDLNGALIKLRAFLKNAPDNRDVRIFLAETLRKKGSIDEAIDTYTSLIFETSENPDLRHALAHCYMQKGNLVLARKTFNQALEIDSAHYASLEQLVLISISLNDFPNAHKELIRYTAKNETTEEYINLLGILLLNEGEIDDAESAFTRVLEKNPKNEQAYIRLAQILIDTDRHDKAIAHLTNTISINPSDINAQIMLGNLYNREKSYAKSANCFSAAIAINPNSLPALNNLAFLNIVHFKNLDNAYKLANRSHQIQPNDPHTADILGWTLYHQQKYSWALALVNESSKKLPNNPEIQYHLGMTHYMLGNQAAARDALSAATRTDLPFSGKTDCLRRLKILDINPYTLTTNEAKRLSDQLAQNSIDTICLIKLAISEKENNPRHSIQLLNSVLEVNPKNAHALIQQAIIHETSGRRDEAFHLARNAYSSNKDIATVNQVLGRLAYSKNQISWAATLLSKALTRVPEDNQTRYLLAKANFTIGRTQTASDLLDQMPNKSEFQLQTHQLKRLITRYETFESDVIDDTILNDDDPFLAIANRAQQLDQLGEILLAQDAYRSLIAAYPDFTPAKYKLAISLYHSETYNDDAYNITVSAYSADRNNPELKKAMDAQAKKREEG